LLRKSYAEKLALMSFAESVIVTSEVASTKSTGELKAPTGPSKWSTAEPEHHLTTRPSSHRGFNVRLAELVVLMTAIVGALALGLGLSSYLSDHRYVLVYLVAYGVFRFAHLLVRDEAALGLDGVRFSQRLMYELPLLLLFFVAPFERTYIYGGDAPRWLCVLGLLIELIGLWLALGARIQLGFFSPTPSSAAGCALVRNGLYHFIRHPIYAGELIVLFAWPFEYGAPLTLVVAVIVGIVVMRRRMRDEEARLLAQFGDEYASYVQVTDRVIPNVW
jgi:protein-S-isoprenylcysteine O-methyltransferase Ste14